MQKLCGNKLPKHVAFIVDGNRRWAKKNNLSSMAGHRHAMYNVLDPIAFHCIKLGIPYLTYWVFSTENWKRGKRFYNALFKLLEEGLNKGFEKYDKAGIRLNTIGNLSEIPSHLAKKIKEWEELSKNNKNLTVTIALNYGGREEIVRAVNKYNEQEKRKLNEEKFPQYLDTADLPDPDLIIRTGGEKRLSGFLLWQCQYSELYFTDTLMPDFSIEKFEKALKDFCQRQRRFGK